MPTTRTLREYADQLQTIADNAAELPMMDDADVMRLLEIALHFRKASDPKPVVHVSFTVATSLDDCDLLGLLHGFIDQLNDCEQDDADTSWEANRIARNWDNAKDNAAVETVSDSLVPCF